MTVIYASQFFHHSLMTINLFYGAGNGIRTRDPNLGKVVLYQLSYSRIWNIRADDSLDYP